MLAFRYKPLAGSAPRTLMLQVSRYQTQAALVANVEEARYQVLVAEDGKMLVRARYAVRNNRRSLLTVRLPSGAGAGVSFRCPSTPLVSSTESISNLHTRSLVPCAER